MVDAEVIGRPSLHIKIYKEDSLKKRYIYKLISNVLAFAMNLVTAGLVPRTLGPKQFGDYSFITNFFSQVITFFDCGTNYSFYAKISQDHQYTPVIAFYSGFILLGSLLSLGFINIINVVGLQSLVWPGQTVTVIFLAAVLAIVGRLIEIPNKMTDAYGYTVKAEVLKLMLKIVATGLIIILSVYQLLTLHMYFAYQYFILILLGITLIVLLARNGHSVFRISLPTRKEFEILTRTFYQNSHPLFILSIISLIAEIADRWLLQRYSGSTQQGFFGFSFNIAFFCSVFTTSITPLLMREFAIASKSQDEKALSKPFSQISPILYLLSAYFSCFIAVEADNVCAILGGKHYTDAHLTVALMVLYPMQQTYGQLTGAFLTITGRTKIMRNISSIFLIVGLPITYFLIAPNSVLGYSFGSTGLAIKTIVLGFIGVNCLLFVCCKLVKVSFYRLLFYQLIIAGILTALGCLSRYLVTCFILGENPLIHFALAGIFYSVCVICIAFFAPKLFGIDISLRDRLARSVLNKVSIIR